MKSSRKADGPKHLWTKCTSWTASSESRRGFTPSQLVSVLPYLRRGLIYCTIAFIPLCYERLNSRMEWRSRQVHVWRSQPISHISTTKYTEIRNVLMVSDSTSWDKLAGPRENLGRSLTWPGRVQMYCILERESSQLDICSLRWIVTITLYPLKCIRFHLIPCAMTGRKND